LVPEVPPLPVPDEADRVLWLVPPINSSSSPIPSGREPPRPPWLPRLPRDPLDELPDELLDDPRCDPDELPCWLSS
jgi:hypothetical protein